MPRRKAKTTSIKDLACDRDKTLLEKQENSDYQLFLLLHVLPKFSTLYYVIRSFSDSAEDLKHSRERRQFWKPEFPNLSQNIFYPSRNKLKLSLNVTYTASSTLTETSILYTAGHKDTRMDRQTDRLIPYTQINIHFAGV